MGISEYAEQNGFSLLTQSNHPKDGQIVTILGTDFNGSPKTETVKWFTENGTHSYQWITHDFNKGIITTTLDYWKP